MNNRDCCALCCQPAETIALKTVYDDCLELVICLNRNCARYGLYQAVSLSLPEFPQPKWFYEKYPLPDIP